MNQRLVIALVVVLVLIGGAAWFHFTNDLTLPSQPVVDSSPTAQPDRPAIAFAGVGERVAVPAPTPAEPESATPPKTESPAPDVPAWKKLRLDELERHRQELLQQEAGVEVTYTSLLSMMGVAMTPILDELGAYEPVAQGVQSKMTPDATSNVFRSGMRIYRVSHGLFPVYDRVMEGWNADPSQRPKRSRTTLQLERNSGVMQMDATTLHEMQSLLDRGRETILRRSEAY